MKLLNVDYVVSDYENGIYLLGKLYRVIDSEFDWVELLKDNAVHISRVYYASDTCLSMYGELPNALSKIVEKGSVFR